MRKHFLLMILMAAGCSIPTPGTKDFDSETARQTLNTALEAWKKGQAARLDQRQPPIRFVDDDWSAGWQLVDFQIQKPDDPIRPFQPVMVELKLRNRQGKTVQKTVGYQVALQPTPAVLRADT